MNCKHNYVVLHKGEKHVQTGTNTTDTFFGQTYAEYLGCTKCGDIKTYGKKQAQMVER